MKHMRYDFETKQGTLVVAAAGPVPAMRDTIALFERVDPLVWRIKTIVVRGATVERDFAYERRGEKWFIQTAPFRQWPLTEPQTMHETARWR